MRKIPPGSCPVEARGSTVLAPSLPTPPGASVEDGMEGKTHSCAQVVSPPPSSPPPCRQRTSTHHPHTDLPTCSVPRAPLQGLTHRPQVRPQPRPPTPHLRPQQPHHPRSRPLHTPALTPRYVRPPAVPHPSLPPSHPSAPPILHPHPFSPPPTSTSGRGPLAARRAGPCQRDGRGGDARGGPGRTH